MASTQNYWYSAPEAVPGTGIHSATNSDEFPEHVSGFDRAPNETGLHFVGDNFANNIPAANAHVGGTEGSLEADKVQRYHQVAQEYRPASQQPGMGPPATATESPRKRICGLSVRMFWIALSVAAVVIVGGAVGGGVAASRISARAQSESTSTSSTTSPASLTSSTSLATSTTSLDTSTVSSEIATQSATPTTPQTTASITTSSIVGQSQTLYRDCPSSDGTVYDVTLGDDTYMFRKYCNIVLVSLGYDNVVTGTTTDLKACIDKCAIYNYQNPGGISSNGTAWYVSPLLVIPPSWFLPS